MQNYQEVVTWLFDQVPNYQHQGGSAYKPGLDRVKALLDYIGNPHKKIKTIHVAGTNGKGSVSHILANAFMAHGYKVGLFTSPHIKDFRERIKINGVYISQEFVVDFVQNYHAKFIAIDVSFFEITTAMAFSAFAVERCDIAIIETGLGGRLDSTNVLTPEMAIITNIGMDHTSFLGDTLPLIANEKAGIIKPNIPVVIGDIDPDLRSIFRDRAESLNAPLFFSQDVPQLAYKTDLLGVYQQRNIHTARVALDQLKEKWKLKDELILSSFNQIRANTNFTGRMQPIGQKPLIMVDAGHNLAGIKSLLEGLNSIDYKRLFIVYGASNDKEWQQIIQEFPKDAMLNLAQFDSKRSVTSKEYVKECEIRSIKAKIHATPIEALNYCKTEAHEDDLILICGSFYLIEKIL